MAEWGGDVLRLHLVDLRCQAGDERAFAQLFDWFNGRTVRYLHNLVGYPFETTLAAAGLILGGTLDRFPALSVVLVHGGGFLPYHIGRFDRGHRTRPETRADGAALPSGYLRRFHYDTLVQRPEALDYLVRTVGHDRVVLGSDHPFWLGDPEPLRIVREARLDPGAEVAILGANAARIFRL